MKYAGNKHDVEREAHSACTVHINVLSAHCQRFVGCRPHQDAGCHV